MDIYLIKLILAHLIGDFFLQPNSWVKDKATKKLKSGKLYIHVAVHIALIFLVFLSFSVWKVALSIGLLHLFIDGAKAIFQTRKNARVLFFIDQIFHFYTIILVWHLFFNGHLDINYLNDIKFWILISSALFLTMPTSIIMKVIIAKWLPESDDESPKSLQNAGKYIGILERVLIFIFITTNHFEAVGFLLAAKSIFRFGDLKEAHDLKLTEYVLIGTLLSFGIAIGIALVVKGWLG
ncbi:uncharacterized protein DUF3307 [Pedobacter psychrotolerans]|uniref:Uncharacterized protein DUF3307 n=1 Tax=Pedobacter psychrotolerans TaxID=1843235 RepID=A0A4R2HCJ2_9SPHI|nr:DUF3307 domain-containing protein [Pedobacter psychrotolerans]TCO25052.1 uncharacterized protein DUF3307 [Pedobacter psychrotolerans]GGE48494.1 hypothetical protein GCM10011413_13220 [Pedobacter psychrotolerans]